jgi:hypothetical protein
MANDEYQYPNENHKLALVRSYDAAAVAGVSENAQISFPDGLEFAAGTGLGISMVGLGATQVAAAVGYGQISFHGFEY